MLFLQMKMYLSQLLVITSCLVLSVQQATGQTGNTALSYQVRLNCCDGESSDGECPTVETPNRAQSVINVKVSQILQSAHSTSDLERYSYSCGGSEGWARIAYLDMTNSTHNCPDYLREVTYGGMRMCTRNSSTFQIGMPACTSAVFPSNSTTYSEVCGKVIGFIYGGQGGLEGYTFRYPNNTIDDYYGDGVTLTHGLVGNRQHIWTFFSGSAENVGLAYSTNVCPCHPRVDERIMVPPWVGDDYFCEAGAVNWPGYVFLDEPLWDGDGCFLEDNECCSFNNPPYFSTHLPASTSDDIELRACGEGGANSGTYPYPSDITVQIVELFVK